MVGGCVRTEHPFRTAPSLGASTGTLRLLYLSWTGLKASLQVPTSSA